MPSGSWHAAATALRHRPASMLATRALPRVGAALDTLIVAGGQGVEAAAADPKLVDWLRKRAARARRVASVCTGAFLLAASGVLDGRRAATHWSVCAELARRFPAVRVEADPIFVRDGPVWTSAGVTAGIDLALALVEQDLGRTVALAVARYLVVFLKRPGGQAQFSAALSLQSAEDRFGTLHDWINGHLADDLSLPVLARRAAMSERSFSRHYAEATGLTPARAVERLRVEAARRLLSECTPAGQTDLSPLRLRLGGNDATQLPAPAGGDAAGLSRAVQLLSPRPFADAAHFPMQKSRKMMSSNSSMRTVPVMRPSARNASRRSSAASAISGATSARPSDS